MTTNMNLSFDGNFSLARHPSVYSLTFDEFQTAQGKEFGSMNMEELLKSIWNAEDSTPAYNGDGGYLQKQSSLTLPRTLSLKTVEEVWKEIARDCVTGKDTEIVAATLGEITLEEFLLRAGVAKQEKLNSNKTEILGSTQSNASDDAPSVSPVPYTFNGDVRGGTSNNTVEKAIERRRRRMVKNRESAVRSRARKQAYNMELEQDLTTLKRENEELKKKQAEFIEKQKDQVLEMMEAKDGGKKRRLTRTLTSPW